jgi:hypothetical protein
MAETSPSAFEQELSVIKKLIWGDDIKPDIFRRWSQGFYFSTSEPTALEQSEGGPVRNNSSGASVHSKKFVIKI